MDVDTLRVLYPSYTDAQLAAVISIYEDADLIQDRINALPEGFARSMTQQGLTQTLRMLADNVQAE